LSEKKSIVAGHKCRMLINRTLGVPIVFLHGYSYTSEVWQRISATRLLEEKQVPFLALDMPYGSKSDCQPHSKSVEINVAVINEAVSTIFDKATPVLVGASSPRSMRRNIAEAMLWAT